MLFAVLSPFAAFALLMMVAPAPVALFAAGSVSLTLLIVDAIRGRSLKALQVAAVSVFAALFFYMIVIDPQLEAHRVRAAIDAAMLVLGIGSMLLRAPFTIQYALETVTPDVAARPEFRRTNYLLTAVWSVTVATMLVANFASALVPWLPLWTGIAVAFVARNGAAAFTQWYVGSHQSESAKPMSN